jgi:hypothetical protein
MRLMAATDRNNVAREIMGGVQAQVAAAGGDFSAVAHALDDPRWVGRQMVRVYGVSTMWVVVAVAACALLARASVPGGLVAPATDNAAVAASLAAYGALLGALLLLVLLRIGRAAYGAAGAAVATRMVALALPQDGAALIDLMAAGELGLFLLATFLIVVIVDLPLRAARMRNEDL